MLGMNCLFAYCLLVDEKAVVVFLKLVMGDKAVWDNTNVKHY
jgi:hypothetical protein